MRYPKEITGHHYGFVPSVSSSRDEWKNFLCTIRRKKTFTLQKKPKKWVVWSWQAFFNTSPFLRLVLKKSFFFQDVPYNRKKLNGLFWRLNVKNGGCVEKYLSRLYYSFFGLFWKCESLFVSYCNIVISIFSLFKPCAKILVIFEL